MYMENVKNTIAKMNYSFKAAYALLSREEQKKVREDIMTRLKLKSRTSFQTKKAGSTYLHAWEADIIRDIFKQYGKDKVFDYEYAN